MVTTGFYLYDEWWIMASLDISEREDIADVYKSLLACDCPDYEARKACMVLSSPNSGYTFTDTEGKYTLIFVSKATSPDEAYNTISHEIRHAADHIGKYYGMEARGEDSAYLQGEIAKKLFPAVAMVVCPICHNEKGEE